MCVCTIAKSALFLTVRVMNIDLTTPIWSIDHVAAALGGLSVDRARKYTSSSAFPAPRAGFAKNLWLRADVLVWFAALPAADRRRSTRRQYSTSPKPVAVTHGIIERPASVPKRYSPRRKSGAVA